ncbi:MAG: toxin-antitoxin system YwqK family antitoxin [Victivallales bacterium]|nr:toxin-antitoxin system YwqK family antitoxin [Victivallales bacterium]
MNDKDKKVLLGTVIAVVIIVVIGLLLLFTCRDNDGLVVEDVAREAPRLAEPEKEEDLPEFIEKKEFYPEGEVSAGYYVYRVNPDIRHKKYTGYYRGGKKKMEYEYKDNSKEGPLVFWYEDEKKAMEGAFLNDKRHGEFKEYHPNGKLKLVYGYNEGVLEGPWTEYYDDGESKMIEKSFKEGLLDGSFIRYTLAGERKEQTFYREGRIVRPATAESE